MMKKIFAIILIVSCLFLSLPVLSNYKPGDTVEAKWENEWFKAKILKKENDKYLIHYDESESSYDEWVTADRLRRIGSADLTVTFSGPKKSDLTYKSKNSRWISGTETVWDCAYSPDGKWFAASGANGNIRLVRTSDFKVVRVIETGPLPVRALDFSPDSKTIIFGNAEGVIVIIDPGFEKSDGKVIMKIKGFHDILSIKYSPDGKHFAFAGSPSSNHKLSTAAIYDSRSGAPVREIIRGIDSQIYYADDIAYSPDGKIIAVAVSNRNRGVELYDVNTGKLVKKIRYSADVSSVVFAKNGFEIAGACSDGKVILWNTLNGSVVRSFDWGKESARACDISPDGKYLAAVGRGEGSIVKIFDYATGKIINSFGNDNPVGTCVMFSRDGRGLAVGTITYGNALLVTIISEYKMP